MTFCIFFTRDTFLIWLTVYEIWRVFWKMAVESTQDPMLKLPWQNCCWNILFGVTNAFLLIHIKIKKKKYSFMRFFLTGHAPFRFLKKSIIFFFIVYIHVIYFSRGILRRGIHFWSLFMAKINGFIIINQLVSKNGKNEPKRSVLWHTLIRHVRNV